MQLHLLRTHVDGSLTGAQLETPSVLFFFFFASSSFFFSFPWFSRELRLHYFLSPPSFPNKNVRDFRTNTRAHSVARQTKEELTTSIGTSLDDLVEMETSVVDSIVAIGDQIIQTASTASSNSEYVRFLKNEIYLYVCVSRALDSRVWTFSSSSSSFFFFFSLSFFLSLSHPSAGKFCRC